MRFFYIIFALSAVLLHSIYAQSGSSVLNLSSTAVPHEAVEDTAFSMEELPLPSVPSGLTVPSARAAYIVGHFWDALDFRDTLRSRNRMFMERNFSTYASLFPHVCAEALPPAIKALMERASSDAVAYGVLCEVAEKYLYEKGSPVYNEDCFIMFLEEMAVSNAGGEALRVRAAFMLEAAGKNRKGSVAADFGYITRSGERHTLHSTHASNLLLMFYDPDCRHCMDTVGMLEADSTFREAVNGGRLTVLAVCVDTDDSRWQSSKGLMPSEWIVGKDADDIAVSGLYDLPSMPVMYLLGKDKKVMVKEATLREITESCK